MKEIGGFFELELNTNGDLYHTDALAFNSGSSALRFFLSNNNYKLIYLPYYNCDEVIKVLISLGLDYHFYNIDADLKPGIDTGLLNEETLLIANIYFGINNQDIDNLLELSPHIIIDASQDFFYKPPANHFSFNSPRKFFGVPDGGFLSGKITEGMLENFNKLSTTDYNTRHLIDRLEKTANIAYSYYTDNEKLISNNPLGKMSKLTKALLNNVDFDTVKTKRQSNFKIMNESFKNYNKIDIGEILADATPLCYPFLVDNGSLLKKYLIQTKIYVPTYWEGIKKYLTEDCSFELDLLENLVCLPIDQIYDENDMMDIIDCYKSFLNE